MGTTDLIHKNVLFPEFSQHPLKKWKQYYISSSKLKLIASDANLLCNIFDLKLVSPINRNELSLIIDQLNHVNSFDFETILLGVYKEDGGKAFINDAEANKNYLLSLTSENVSNGSCLAFRKVNKTSSKSSRPNKIELKNISCESRTQFMCEENFSKLKEKNTENSDLFLKKLAQFSFNKSQDSISKALYINHEFLKSTWIKAQQICGSFGMDLFVPESAFEYKLMKQEFRANPDLPSSFHIGALNINRDYVSKIDSQRFYSIATNKYLNFEMSNQQEDNQHCLMMKMKKEVFIPKQTSCTENVSNFICQKILLKLKPSFRFVPEPDSTTKDYEIPYYFNWAHVKGEPKVKKLIRK